ncbi:MAG: dTMP kinase [Phycisphaerae bacterium]|nr:dTMP kinase [Phycisphaerae bacterium]
MTTPNSLNGKFIVLDGPDGCGKSTQAHLLAEWIRAQGLDAVGFRDPGDTAVGEKIRDILLDPEHIALGPRAELLLYMAARAQLWEEKIAPALASGACVVMDRWVSSTCAYQGCAGGLGIQTVLRIAADSLERTWPDLTIVLDVDEAAAAARMNRQLDRMEQKGRQYHQKVRQGYLELARNYDAVVHLDATVSIEALHDQVIAAVRSRFAADKS